MKTSVLVLFLGLAVLTVLCSASELANKELVKEVLRAMLVDKEDALQPEERECRYYLGGCKKDSECCTHLQCHSYWEWCIWDGTFGK
uniref:Toxin-like peptide n=1 Tax=Grammostola rosea TaxID=432528 RepID=H7CEK6_GRARO|nr:toxin-like peptide [Grammostola rosea]